MEDDNKQNLADAGKLADAIGELDIDVDTMQNAVDALKDFATVRLGLKVLAHSREKFQQWVQKIGKVAPAQQVIPVSEVIRILKKRKTDNSKSVPVELQDFCTEKEWEGFFSPPHGKRVAWTSMSHTLLKEKLEPLLTTESDSIWQIAEDWDEPFIQSLPPLTKNDFQTSWNSPAIQQLVNSKGKEADWLAPHNALVESVQCTEIQPQFEKEKVHMFAPPDLAEDYPGGDPDGVFLICLKNTTLQPKFKAKGWAYLHSETKSPGKAESLILRERKSEWNSRGNCKHSVDHALNQLTAYVGRLFV